MTPMYIFNLEKDIKNKKYIDSYNFKIYLNNMRSTKKNVLCLSKEFFTHKGGIFQILHILVGHV